MGVSPIPPLKRRRGCSVRVDCAPCYAVRWVKQPLSRNISERVPLTEHPASLTYGVNHRERIKPIHASISQVDSL